MTIPDSRQPPDSLSLLPPTFTAATGCRGERLDDAAPEIDRRHFRRAGVGWAGHCVGYRPQRVVVQHCRGGGTHPPQQVRLEKGITSPTVVSQSNVIATELRSQFDSRGKPLLPAGSHVSINDATFHALSAQLATVDAVVSGPDPGRWQLVLVREAGRWLLLSTRKVS